MIKSNTKPDHVGTRTGYSLKIKLGHVGLKGILLREAIFPGTLSIPPGMLRMQSPDHDYPRHFSVLCLQQAALIDKVVSPSKTKSRFAY